MQKFYLIASFVYFMTSLLLSIRHFDTTLTTKIFSFASRFFPLGHFCARSGDVIPWLFSCFFFFVFDFFLKRTDILIHFFVTMITAIFTTSLKYLIRRSRPVSIVPPEYVGKGDFWSFPSGHSGRMGCLAVSMLFMVPQVGWFFVIWAFIVAFGRIAVGVHYFFDVICGLLTGCIVTFIILHFYYSDLTVLFQQVTYLF